MITDLRRTYPSAYVLLETEMWWQGSIPIVTAGTTRCLRNHGSNSPISKPTSVSTPQMTADPTDPKGLFYELVGYGNWQMKCGAAADVAQSWHPEDLLVSVYSSCYCQPTLDGPVQPLHTAQYLLATETRYARLASAGRSSLIISEPTNSAPIETSRPEPLENTGTAPVLSSTNTVRQITGSQTPSQTLDTISTTRDSGPLQNVVSRPETTTAEPSVVASPTLSISSPQPSSQIKSNGNTSASATTVTSASSRSAPSVEKPVVPPSASSSSEVSMSSAPVAQTATELHSVQTQSDIVKPQVVHTTSPETGSLTQNSTPVSSSALHGSADLGLPSQPTTQSPSVLVKPVAASAQSAATTSDVPAAAVIVADGQLSMVSVEPYNQSGPSPQSSAIRIGDIIANGIGETRTSSEVETTSKESVTTEASPTTHTAADTETSSPVITTTQASRTSDSSQTRSSTSQKTTSRAIASPSRARSSTSTSQTSRAAGDIIASVMGVTRSTGSASRLGSEGWLNFAVGLIVMFHVM